MSFRFCGALLSVLILAKGGMAGGVALTVSDPEGAAGAVCAPVSAKVDVTKAFGAGVQPPPEADPPRVGARLRLFEVTESGEKKGDAIPVQVEANGMLWWLMPTGGKGERRFQLSMSEQEATAALSIKSDEGKKFYDVSEGQLTVLRYNHGAVPVPPGIDPKYERGDYICPLYGLSGEVLTDDYPKDHPHHRAVWWSWPVTRWDKEVRDIWAVRGVWARPVAMRRAEAGPVMAILEAENVWKWGDKDPIVKEEVVIRAFRQGPVGRFVDVEVRLTALADGVAIGGRPKAGYGGFALRAAKVEQQTIVAHIDPPEAEPRRSWLDYSGIFAGGKERSGVAIFEHVTNPGYPNEVRQYPNLNCVMPAFPCTREVPLAKEKPLILNHRLWIHDGGADENILAQIWAAYATAPIHPSQ